MRCSRCEGLREFRHKDQADGWNLQTLTAKGIYCVQSFVLHRHMSHAWGGAMPRLSFASRKTYKEADGRSVDVQYSDDDSV